MNSTDLLTAFRREMNDRTEPYLWPDEEVFGFIDQAQQMFCRRTDGIADARSPVTALSVVPNTDWYSLDLSVLQVRQATRADDGRSLELLTAELARKRGVRFLPTLVGEAKTVVTGLEPHAVRISPMPNETVTLNLSIYRLPLVAITDAGDQALEIEPHHHIHLLLWMKHRAYDNQDAEVHDRRKSDEFEAKFYAYCESVKREQERARRAPGLVAYGGL